MSLNCVNFTIKRGARLPSIDAILQDENDEAVSLTGADSVVFVMRPKRTLVPISGSATIVEATEGHVRYNWGTGDTLIPGFADAQFVVFFGSNTMVFPSDNFIVVNVTDSLT